MALQRAGIEAVIEGYGNFISGISEMSGKVNSFGQEAGTVAGQVAAFGQSVAGYGEALVGLGSKLTIALTTPLLSLGVLVSNAAIEYETAIAGVAKTTDGVVQTTQQLLDGLEDSFPELSQEQLLEKIELIPFSQRLTEVGHELEEAFRSLSLEIPVPATELAKIGEIAGQLGISAENLVEFTRIVAALGVSTELSTEQAALSLGRLVAVFGVAEDEVNTFALNVGGALVALGNNLATTEGPISNFAVRVAGTFSALDIPVQYLLAIGAAITATGSQVEAGGSSIQAALLSLHSILTNAGGVIDNTQEITDATLDLQMAQAQIIKQQETLNKENVSAGTAAVATARLADYTNQVAELQTQLEVLNGTNGLPATGQKLQTLARLTGQSVEELKRLWAEGGTSRAQVFIQFLEGLAAEGENMALVLKDLELDGIRSVRTLLSLAGGVETLQRAVELSTSQFALQGTQVEISNALLEEARIRYSTTESQLQILKNTFTNLAIVVGSQLLPVIVPVAQKIADSILQITSSFEALAPAKKFMVFFGGALLAALGPVITAVGAVTIVVGTLTTALASLIGLGGGLGGVLLGFGSLLFQLSSFDTGIIGTIATNLRAVYDNFVAAIPGGGLYDVLQVLLSQGTGDLPYIKELLYNIRDAIQTPLESAIGGALIAIPYILNSIANIAVQFSGLINSVLLTAISGIDYQGVAQVLLHGFAVVIASVNQHLPSLMQPLKIELFGATLFGADVLDPARPQIIGLAEGIIPMIRGKLAMLVHGVVEFWYTQMDVLAQNIPSIFTVLADAISFGAGAVYDILSAFYDIFDTTKDTIGEFISGMGTQIARLIGIFLDVDQIDLGTTFGTAISSFGDAAAILINTILPAIVEHFTRFVDYVEANGPRIAESLRAMLSGPFLAQVQQFANWIAQNIDQIAKAFLVLQGAIFGLERLRDLGLFLRPFNSAVYNIEITLHSLGQVAGVVGGALGLLAAPFTAVGQAATFALKGISSLITSLSLSLSPLSAFTPSKVVVPVKPVVQLQDVEFPPEYNQQFDRIADAFLASNLPTDGLGIIELPITPKPKLELPDLVVDDLVDTKGNVAATTKLKDQLLKFGASTVAGLASFGTKIQNLFLHPITTISAAFSSVGGGLLSGLGSIASGIVAAFNPVTIIIAAVTGAILALGAAASGLDFSNVFGSLFEGDFTTFFAEIKQGFSNIGEGAKTGIGAVVVAIQPLIDAFKRIGESFGAFSYLADPLADLFNQLAEAGKIMGPQLLTVLGAIAGVIVVLLTGVVSAVAGALPGIAEAIGGIVDILTGIVEIATGVSQVVIGIFTLSGDKIKEGLNNIGAGFGDVFVGIIEVIGGALHAVLGAVLGFTQGISAAIAGIAGALGASGVATFFQNIVNYIDIILQGLQALGSGIGQGLRHAFDSIGDVLGGIGEFVSSIISAFQYLYDVLVGNSIVPDLVMAIVDWFFQLPELVLSVLGQGLLQIATLFGQLGLAILAQINPFLPQMVIMGYDLITGVAKGIIGGAAELGLSLITALHDAIESGREFLGSHSPSVLAAETLGAPIPQGIAQGIYGSSGEIDAALAGALGGAFANTDVTGQAEAYGHQVASVIASIIGSSGQATPIDVGQASGILNLIPEDALANLSEFNQGVLQTAASAGLAADKFISLALQAGISLEDMKDVISQAALDQKFEELQNAVADGSMSFEDAATSFEHFKSQVEQGVGVVVDVDMSTYLNAKDQFDALEEQGVEVNIIPLPPAKPIKELLLPEDEFPVPLTVDPTELQSAILEVGGDMASDLAGNLITGIVSSTLQPVVDAMATEAARLERAAQTRANGVEGGLMGGGAAIISPETTNNIERLRLEYEAIDDTPLVPTFDFTGFEDFNTAASDSFAALPTEAQPHLDQLAINTTATLDTMSASFTTWGGTATGILSTATGDMAAVLSDGDLVNTWSGTLDDMVSATSEKSIAVVDQFREIIAASEIVIGQADFYTLGVNLVAGLIAGIVSQAGAAAEAAGAVVQGAVDAGNAAAQTQSPSKLTYETGQNMSAGLAEGIADGTHQVQEAAQDTVNAAVWEIENPSFGGTTIMDTPLWQQVIGDLALDRGFVTQYFGLIADAANDYTSGNWQGLQGQLAQAVAEANAEAESSTAQTVDSFADAATTMADQFDEIITGGVESTMSNITTLLSAWAVDHSLEEILGFADTFSSAGSTFADMFTEQVLDPLQELIDEATEAQDQVVSDFGELFDDITSEDLIGRWFNADDPLIADLELEELWKRALGDIFGDEAVKNLNLEELQQLILDNYGVYAAQTLQLQELFTDDELALINDYIQAQQERLRLEEEFAAEQERVLALQQQQQQLEFLQQQFDLIQAITDAGLDPAEILDGITLGLDASLPDLIEAMTVAMQALVTAANEELQIQSPSKVFMGISKQIIGGLTGGLTKYGGQAVSAMTSVLQGVSGSYTPYPTVMGNSHYNSTVDKSVHIKVDANYGKSQSPATIKADLLSLTGVVW